MRRNAIVFSLVLIFAFQLHSQELEVGVYTSLGVSIQKLDRQSERLSYQNSYSYGLSVQKSISGGLSLLTGLCLLEAGTWDDIYMPSFPGLPDILKFKTRAISIPLNIDYSILNKKRIEISIDAGIIGSYVIHEEGSIEDVPMDNLLQITSFPVYYNHGVSLKVQLSDHVRFVFRPTYKTQLFTNLAAFKISAFDLGLTYRFYLEAKENAEKID